MPVRKHDELAAKRRQRSAAMTTTAISGTLLLCAAAGVANASEASETAEPAAASSLDEVVVTGTRIVRDGFEAPTPVTVLNAEDIHRDAPQNIADFLNKQPAFANSVSNRFSSRGGVSGAGSGVSNVNLRGIGANRTLVLLDGVRIVAGSIGGFYSNGGAVNTNVIPDSLIERIDVVTGGASAPYGSDAVAGIVNFILDKDFTGLKGSAQGGATSEGDDEQYSASLAGGMPFADGRGHVLVSAAYDKIDGIEDGAARDWMREGWGRMVNPAYTATNGQPYYLLRPNVGSATAAAGGLIPSGPLRGTTFGAGGVPRAFNYGMSDGSLMSGGDWELGSQGFADASLDLELERRTLFTRVSYQVTDDAEVYLQIMDADADSSGACCAMTRRNITISNQNPFIPASVLSQMQAAGVTSFPLSIYMKEQGPTGVDISRAFSQYVLGTRGSFGMFGSSWSWDVYATESTSRSTAKPENDIINGNLTLALDAVRDPVSGSPICRSTLTNPGNGCVPWNPMGIGMNSQAAIDYVYQDRSWMRQDLTQRVAAASIHGEPFSTWAGPVSLALGAEYRREEVETWTTALDEASAFYVGNYKATNGHYNIKEAFLETVVPLAKDTAWARSLDFNGAVRATDYSTSGSVVTWKLGATYKPIDDIRFRVTRSLDIRSPNMGELFNAGLTAVTNGQRDPFQGNQTVTVLSTQIGNPELKPEEADTFGIGVVLQPRFLPNLSASIDYYSIDLEGAITSVTTQDLLDLCYAGNQELCGFIQRDPNGTVRATLKPINAAALKTEGIDTEISYVQPLSELFQGWTGSLTARALVTRVMDLTTIRPDGTKLQGAGVTGGAMYPIVIAPDWRYSLTLAYNTDALSISATGRGFSDGEMNSQWIECTSGCPAAVIPNYTIDNNTLPGAIYLDLSMSYRPQTFASAFSPEIFLAIDNVNDKNPIGYEVLDYAPGFHETLGRVYRAGIRFKM
ncbi:TonB-dependent receptor plug domain-containing protein [Peristeroidobacter soli]|uniref:TonB-dependent receptor plug domain-containing protein n=1 Tax=Peristeroidobacter soli TaxID=2497877 RepID=UPI00101B7601|nr:TonB-dependent receptor [Peristeroidobacter soli]